MFQVALAFSSPSIIEYPTCLFLRSFTGAPHVTPVSSPVGRRTDWRGSQMKRGTHRRPGASSQLTHPLNPSAANQTVLHHELSHQSGPVAASAILFSVEVLGGQMRKPSIALSGLSAHDKRLGCNQSFSLIFPFQKRVSSAPSSSFPSPKEAVEQAPGCLLIRAYRLQCSAWGMLCYMVCRCIPKKQQHAAEC